MGGGGIGAGATGFGGPGSGAVQSGQPSVRGALDKEIIRRIVRKHIQPRVQDCYKRELQRSPNLRGRVVVQFTIDPTGVVASAVIQSSNLSNPAAESCIVSAVRRARFPKPRGGGIVIVSYPFVLAPN